MKENIVIGKIFNVHGIKGELKVLPLTDECVTLMGEMEDG